MILDREPIFYDMKNVAPMINGMRTISRNINQIAKKANETNSIYAEDIEKVKEEQKQLCQLLNTFVFTIMQKESEVHSQPRQDRRPAIHRLGKLYDRR